MESPCLVVFHLRSSCHSLHGVHISLERRCCFSGVNHKPAISKMWARRYDPVHKFLEEVAAGEAEVWWRSLWKLWETLIQLGWCDTVCLPQKSFQAWLPGKGGYEIRGRGYTGCWWGLKYSVLKSVWALLLTPRPGGVEWVQIKENHKRLVAVRNS